MNIQRNNWLLNRRHVLRGLGASIALPMLDCMRSSVLSASELPNPTPPKRSVFLYIPNGVNTLTWQIEQAGADYAFTDTLKSLERHRNEVTPISGLHHPKVLGKHHNCDKVWLTGANVPANGGAFRNSVSVDQLMAEVQGKSTRYASLELAIEGHSLAWSRDGIQIPAERNVKTIFNRLFGVEREGKDVIRQHPRCGPGRCSSSEWKTWFRRSKQTRRVPDCRSSSGRANGTSRRLAECAQA